MSLEQLQSAYLTFQSQGEVLAGNLLDIPRRVAILTHLYLDSGRNHTFPQIAAHGALWGLAYFESGGTLGRLIASRYCYSRSEKAYRMGILREFAEGFRRVNRQVCIDTYEFTKKFGEQPEASEIIPAKLLDALNRVHHARRSGIELPSDEKQRVFEHSFRCEQETTVAPGVTAAINGFDCRIMRWLCLHPFVRFSYFPRLQWLWFRNFGDTEERIEKGLRSYEFAERAGWDQVFASMEYYGQMPRQFFEQPETHFADLKRETIERGQVAVNMT